MASVWATTQSMTKMTSFGNPKFNKSKKTRTMKKIFYILASAIVALGAVACDNEGLDNIAPEANGDTVSFVATIDNTKTDLGADLSTVWTAGDVIKVEWNGKTYDFTNSDDDVNTFSCTDEGLSAIKTAEIKATYSNNNDGAIDSEAGTAGALLTYEGAFSGISFDVKNAFLKFTATEGAVVTLTASAKIFSTTDGTTFHIIATGEAQYVAINPATTTITYAIDGNTIKTSQENTLEAKNIYNLGELKAAEVYLVPTAEWSQDNAWFAARFTEPQTTAANVSTRAGETEAWVKMTDNDYDGVYECSIPGAYNKVTFYRMNPGSDKLDLSNKWNYSKTLDVTAYACCVISGWDNGGTWGEKPAAPTYAVAGTFDNWAGTNMTAVDGKDHLYVKKSIKFDAYGQFKLKSSTNVWWGTSTITNANQNVYFKLDGNSNIKVVNAGTYDIYFDRANLKVYLMESGKSYTAATEQTENGKDQVIEDGNRLYLKPNANWKQASARFAVYTWDGGEQWFNLTLVDGETDIYTVLLPKTIKNIIFCRMNPGNTANNWNQKWNQTSNLTVPTNGTNLYTVKESTWDKGGGTWSTYTAK